MTTLLYAGRAPLWPVYEPLLHAALNKKGITARIDTDFPPEEVDYIIYAPSDRKLDFGQYANAKAVLSLWAGVERIVTDETLTQPLTRMVDPGLTQGMIEWVTGYVLRHHIGMDRYIVNPANEWKPVAPPLSKDRPVTILGLGALGTACGEALRGLGFPVKGWSRTEKHHEDIECFHGEDGLEAALKDAEIVILLLPLTADTDGILTADRMALLAQGAVILNPGRGPLIDDEALLAALDSGQLDHATLDVFRVEPLPEDHPFWRHPKVTVSPHIASESRPETCADIIAENVWRGENDQPFLYLVDRQAGY